VQIMAAPTPDPSERQWLAQSWANAGRQSVHQVTSGTALNHYSTQFCQTLLWCIGYIINDRSRVTLLYPFTNHRRKPSVANTSLEGLASVERKDCRRTEPFGLRLVRTFTGTIASSRRYRWT
jgi:hypothetical protein